MIEALGLVVLAWLAVAAARIARRVSLRAVAAHAVLPVGLAVLIGTALLATSAMPLHEHNSFVARADCARDADCYRDPAAPGWAPGFFVAYGWVLRLAPATSAALCRVSLACSALFVVLAHVFLVRVTRRAGDDEAGAREAAAWGTALLVANPLFVRVAAAETPWPYVLCLWLCAAHATLDAEETERPVVGALAGLAAVACFVLGSTTNLVMLVGLPLALVGPWVLRPPGTLRARPSGAALTAAAVCWVLLAPLAASTLRTVRALEGDGGHWHRALYHPFLDSTVQPVVLALLVAVGVLHLARQPWVIAVALLAGGLHPTLVRHAGHPVLGSSYPVGFLNLFPLIALATLLAAAGARRAIAAAGRRARLARAGLAFALAAPLPLAHEAWTLLRGERVLERELAALTEALPRLPPHDRLFVPTRIQERIDPRIEYRSDPIEAFFPVGEYRRHHPRAPTPGTIDQLEPAEVGDGTLVYVGATQRAFHPAEIAAGVVPDALERPELQRLRERWDLVPALTFDITTAQHPRIPLRLVADRADRATLGFYWLRSRTTRRSGATP